MQVATWVPWPLKETFSELSPMPVIEKVTKVGSIWAYPTKGIKKLIMITKWTKIMVYTLILKWCLEHRL